MLFPPFVFACSIFPLISLAIPSLHRSPFSGSSHHRARSLSRDRTLNPGRPRLMTYYADWAPPQNMDYSQFDTIIFAFAMPDQNFALGWDTSNAPDLLANLVPDAHAKKAKVMLSVGGWTGSKYFSNAVSTPQSREMFATSILKVYKQYNLDGIDIDWEYPGQPGDDGNFKSSSDSANMLEFFKVLQQKLPQDAMISAAVQDSTFAGPDGQPMKDVSAFPKLVNWITLMNYDTYGVRQPGPNAPLYDGCGNSSQPTQSAVGGYNAWTSAGFPPSQIMLGIPAYGYVVDSTATRLSTRSGPRAVPEDGSGQIQFNSLVAQGILMQNPNGSFVGSGGFDRHWDTCSATPYLTSESARQVIPYDDPESLGMKAAWARDMNLAGVILFDIHGDTSQHDLTRAVLANLFSIPVPQTTSPGVVPGPSSVNTVSPPRIVPPSPSSISSTGSRSGLSSLLGSLGSVLAY